MDQLLQFIGFEMVLVPQNEIASRPTRPLHPPMTTEVEIKLPWMSDHGVHNGPGQYVLIAKVATRSILIQEERSMVPLL